MGHDPLRSRSSGQKGHEMTANTWTKLHRSLNATVLLFAIWATYKALMWVALKP
jgi:hypothetical protein